MQQNNNSNQVNVIDLFFYLLPRWYWFFLCIAVCVGFAYWKYARTPMVYRSDATVIIKDPGNSRSTVHMDNYSGLINRVSMSNEILQLQSKQLMSEVVKTLDADINYTVHERLRDIELYDRTPVRMFIVRDGAEFEYFKAKVHIDDPYFVRLDIGLDSLVTARLQDTVSIKGTKVIFKPTGLYVSYLGREITIEKYPVASATAAYLSRIKITQAESDGSILNLSLQDYSLRRASDILNTLVEKYNEDAIREKNRIAVNTASFINERLVIIQEELGDVEGELAHFKSSERIMNVDEAASGYLSESKRFSEEIVKVETQLRLAEYLEDYLRTSFNSYETVPVNTGLEDANIDRAISEYNTLILQRDRLIEASSKDSPAVRQVEASLMPLRQNILGFIDNLRTSLTIRKKDLSSREQESIRKFTTMPSKAREILSIERQQKIKETLYIYLLNKREENALTQAMVDNNAWMIDSASGSSVPIYPSRNKMLLLALLLGIFVPAVILISRLFIDTKIRSRADIVAAGDLPFLAEIPETKNKRRKKAKKGQALPPVAEYDNSSKVFKEAMRMMVTNIDFAKPDNCKCPVLMTSSFNAGAGKSFVTRNVAACLADAKRRVIIVDADLRKRSISEFFGLRHKTSGLSNYLVDKDMSLDSVIHSNVLDGVDLIPAGHVPPNPTELLSRERFLLLLEFLRARYDYILLDGTPVNMVADSMVLSPLVDMNLFVLRSGYADRRQLPMLSELCTKGQLRNLSIVLNGTNIRKIYGYSYGYGYGYGYGGGYYGYGEGRKALIHRIIRDRYENRGGF